MRLALMCRSRLHHREWTNNNAQGTGDPSRRTRQRFESITGLASAPTVATQALHLGAIHSLAPRSFVVQNTLRTQSKETPPDTIPLNLPH
jgi:hypothetical protein